MSLKQIIVEFQDNQKVEGHWLQWDFWSQVAGPKLSEDKEAKNLGAQFGALLVRRSAGRVLFLKFNTSF